MEVNWSNLERVKRFSSTGVALAGTKNNKKGREQRRIRTCISAGLDKLLDDLMDPEVEIFPGPSAIRIIPMK